MATISLRLTNCGATGPSGPTNTQIINTYAEKTEAAYITPSSKPGIQQVRVKGLCKIQAVGASSIASSQSTTGLGVSMYGEFLFEKETTLYILVGQQGVRNPTTNTGTSGGGGGTFVTKSLTSEPLLIAGGGGGCRLASSNATYVGTAHGTTSNNGRNGSVAGGTNGNGGSGTTSNGAGGGGGFYGDGGDASTSVTGGKSFVNGGQGGINGGGFGGGGGAYNGNDTGGGGGGGYSGGGGWLYNNSPYYAGGGGSYNIGTNQNNQEQNNYGHGYVIITMEPFLTAPPLNDYQYFILDGEDIQDNNISSNISTVTLDEFAFFAKRDLEFSGNNIQSLLIASNIENILMKIVSLNQLIQTNDYFEILNFAKIIKLQITESTSGDFIRYIFCIDDKWYWLQNNNWIQISLSNFTEMEGNTAIQISGFTQQNWQDFDNLFSSNEEFFNRKIKIACLLIHTETTQKPTVTKITAIVSPPDEYLSISSNGYTTHNYYDKTEIIWNDSTKSKIEIQYV